MVAECQVGPAAHDEKHVLEVGGETLRLLHSTHEGKHAPLDAAHITH
jgi:hypothetical protein